MAIKLIVCDLDGTLLTNENEISSKTKEAIRASQAKGVQFCIATGRMFRSAAQFVEQLGCQSIIISYNGALVKNLQTEEVLFSLPLSLDVAQRLLYYCQKKGWYVQKYTEDCLCVEKLTGYGKLYAQRVNVPVNVEQADFYRLKKAPDKLMLVVEPAEQAAIIEELKIVFGEEVYLTTSNDRFIEIIQPGVTKARAVGFLAELLQVEQAEIMAVGDSFNDLEMLQFAGVGVAMGNAAPEVKAASDYITASNQHDGVAQAIEKYVLNRVF